MVSDCPLVSDAESKAGVVVDAKSNDVPSDGTATFSIVTLASFVLVNVHMILSPAATVSPFTMSNPPVQTGPVATHPGGGVSSLA